MVKNTRRDRRLKQEQPVTFDLPQRAVKRAAPLKPLNAKQERYLHLIETKDMIFSLGSAGTGKAQPLDANILTPDGWVKMGDLKVGDTISAQGYGSNKVLAIHPQGEKQIYKITFRDGRVVECCADHLWKTFIYARKPQWKIEKTSDIISKLKMPSLTNRIYIEHIDVVDTKEDYGFYIHPYILGFLIGDGGLTLGDGRFTTTDQFIVDKINNLLPKASLATKTPSGKYSYNIINKKRSNENLISTEIRKLGLNKTSYYKSIPHHYIDNASKSQKIEILQGLFDADGYVGKKGNVSYCTVSEKLAYQIQNLIWYLGGQCKIKETYKFYSDKNGNKKRGALTFILGVRLSNPEILFTLPRRRERAEKYHQYRNCFRLKVVSVEESRTAKAQCITVSNPNSLYITDNYIVTHNTYTATAWAADALRNKEYNKLIITRPIVEAGESLGFLPGEPEEKVAPYFAPILDILNERLGKSYVENLIKNGNIEFIPLAYMRGRSFSNTIVLLDEAQNVSTKQMKMFLSRFGEGSKFIIDGDYRQTDIDGDCGLIDAERRFRDVPEIGFVTFTKEDIVRSGLCRKIIEGYEK